MGLEWSARDLVHCAPVPDWVDYQPYRSQIPDTETSCIANGTCRLLYDIQTDLSQGSPAWHYRAAHRVLTREGAERAAHFVVDFDPGYQRLEVHFISILRGGDRIEHAKPEAFQLLRRETNLERLVFDGRLTASLVIPDVRVDDIVEVAVTLCGSAPLLSGKHQSWITFDGFNPVFEHRQRLLRPLDRTIHIKPFNDPPQPRITEHAGREDLRWQLIGQPRRLPEELTPSWNLPHPVLQLSEFENWNDVALLLAPCYEPGTLPEALVLEVDRIGLEYADPSERAVEWLRFVQRELRYFAVSMGEGGLTPRPVEAIWSTRFGDCKDASTVYVAGARRLGLDSCAALVSTTHGYALKDFLPSAAVFDHCIVRLRLDGRSYWLDPTIPVQFGNLANVYQPHPGWALPLTTQTIELERMSGEEALHVLHWEDEIALGPKRESLARVRRKIDYSFWAADTMRNRIANEGPGGFVQGMLKDWQSVWPGVTATEPVEVHDDRALNKLSMVLKLAIPDAWKAGEAGKPLFFRTVDLATGHELKSLPGPRRDADIYLGRPRKITNLVHIKMPVKWNGGWALRFEASHLGLINRLTFDGRNAIHYRELVIGAWSMPAGEVRSYNDMAARLQENVLALSGRQLLGKMRPHIGTKGMLILGVQAVWYIVWGAFLLSFIVEVLKARR